MGWFRRAKNYVGVFLFGVKIAGDWREALEELAEYAAIQERRARLAQADRERAIVNYLRREVHGEALEYLIEKIESGETLE